MAFDIMQLFAPGALNRLLQPQQNAQGMQNFLANPGAVQQQPQMAPQLPAPINVGQVPEVAQADPWLGMREGDVQQIDPMMTGAAQAQGQPIGSVAVPDKPGGLDKYTKDIFRENLNQFFLGMASGSNPADSLSRGAMAANAKHNDMKNANQTVAWLQSKGMDKEQAWALAQSPPALSEYLKSMVQGTDPQAALQLQKTQLEINKLRQGRPENYTPLTGEEKQQLGLDPAKAYQRGADNKISEIGGNGVSVNVEAPKLPSGYRFLDTSNPSAGVEPIPGGPATQLPGELAARIGMADNWLQKDYPSIKKDVTDGNVTGAIDLTAAKNNKGAGAPAYRKLQSGVEVLSRLLSGAGMTQVEIDEKAARYQPSYLDDAAGMASKLDQLKTEIEATRDAALAGRGGPIRGNDQNADPLGIR